MFRLATRLEPRADWRPPQRARIQGLAVGATVIRDHDAFGAAARQDFRRLTNQRPQTNLLPEKATPSISGMDLTGLEPHARCGAIPGPFPVAAVHPLPERLETADDALLSSAALRKGGPPPKGRPVRQPDAARG